MLGNFIKAFRVKQRSERGCIALLSTDACRYQSAVKGYNLKHLANRGLQYLNNTWENVLAELPDRFTPNTPPQDANKY